MTPPPPGELRAVKVIPNKAAQQDGFTIPTNMRVPVESVIHSLFHADPMTDGNGEECLSHWESQGRSLGRRAVIVEARKVPDRVIAIVQPVAPRQKKATHETEAMFSDVADLAKSKVKP